MSASSALKLEAIGKVDRDGNDYYFTTPHLACMVDLSKVVIFVHPWSEDEGEKGETGRFGADIIIKEYTGKRKKRESSDDG